MPFGPGTSGSIIFPTLFHRRYSQVIPIINKEPQMIKEPITIRLVVFFETGSLNSLRMNL